MKRGTRNDMATKSTKDTKRKSVIVLQSFAPARSAGRFSADDPLSGRRVSPVVAFVLLLAAVSLSYTPVSGQVQDSTVTLALPPGAADTTSLSFKDADIRDVLRGLSLRHGVNIFVDNSVSQRTTVALNRVRVHDAIVFVVEQNGLDLKLEGGVYKVQKKPEPPKPVPPPRPQPMVYYEKGFLSVKAKQDALEDLIELIQERTGKNILITQGTSGPVTGTLNDIEFEVGFTQLMNLNGFAVQKKNNIYVVSRSEYFVGGNAAAGQSQRTSPYWVSVADSLVTLDVTNAPLERVLQDVTRQLNRDVVFYNAVTGSVTARATSVTVEKALDLILRNTNFTYRFMEGTVVVGEKSNRSVLDSRLVRLNHLRAEKTTDLLPQSITSQVSVNVVKEHNGLFLVGPRDVIAQASEVLSELDKPVAQVLIEAIVVDYDRSKGFDFGVDAGVGGYTDTTRSSRNQLIPGIDALLSGAQIKDALQGVANIGKLPSDFYFRLRAMQERGVANIKSRPLLATLNGHPATLSIGTTFYFKLLTTTPYRDPSQVYLQTSEAFKEIVADTKLEITPYVGPNGSITLELKPDFRTPSGQPAEGIPPPINNRSLSSTLILKEGETIIVGGLIQETDSEVRSQTPLIGSIPLLGYLFSSTSTTTRKSELVIYVTPHISYGEAFKHVSVSQEE